MKHLLIFGGIAVAAYFIVKQMGGGGFSLGLTVNDGTAVPDDFGKYDSTRGFLDNPSGDASADAAGGTT